jgi:LysM repeat protein
MNSTNPLKPQGSQFEQAASAARHRFQLAVYVSLAVCAVSLTVLLAVGCKKEDTITPPPPPPATDYGTPLTAAPIDTNPVPPVTGGPLPGPDPSATGATGGGLPPSQPGTVGGPGTSAQTPPPPPPVADTPPVPPPSAPAGTKEYVVQPGDSFYTIGKKLGVNWKAIEKANPTIVPTKLKQGDKIIVPEAATPATPPAGTTVPTATGGSITHKVVAGDNLSKLAKKYGVSAKAIQKANRLTTTRIKVGDQLTIPAKAAPAENTPPPAMPPPVAPPAGPGTAPADSPATPGIPGSRPA